MNPYICRANFARSSAVICFFCFWIDNFPVNNKTIVPSHKIELLSKIPSSEF